MKVLSQTVFSEFKKKVLEPSYSPTHPVETLKARLTAAWQLQSQDNEVRKKAKVFLLKTSLFKEQDLLRLEQLASQVKSWDELHICSTYTNITGDFIEYKLSITTVNKQQVLHFHARFETQDKICCFVSQTAPLLRIAGDSVLQKPGILFPKHPTLEQQQELANQIELATSLLTQSGGAGISANQCAAIAKPYCFTIIGVFHDIPEHAASVEKRYPSTKFLQAMVMVNPVITAVSKVTQSFNHGCLSVPCPNRCTVISPRKMSVKYQDPLDAMRFKEITLNGVDAVVLWHELTHIIYGKTYMDITFSALPIEDLNEFQNMVHHELQRREIQSYTEIPELTAPPFHFSVKLNAQELPRLDSKELAEALPKMTSDTLSGLLNQARIAFKNK